MGGSPVLKLEEVRNMKITIIKSKNDFKSLNLESILSQFPSYLSAKEFKTKSGDLIILYGDCPLITVDTIKKLINTKKKGADLSVLGFLSNNQKEYGRMVVDENNNNQYDNINNK